jgi:hypothetical protein
MRTTGRNAVCGRSDLYRGLVRTGGCGMVDRYPLEGVGVGVGVSAVFIYLYTECLLGI